MNEQMEEYQEKPEQFEQPVQQTPTQPAWQPPRRRPLPNASAVLVLGICSVVLGCFAIGLVLGIIGLVLAKKSRILYRADPELYSDYGNVQAGFILSIIGICIGSLAILYYICIFLLVIFGASHNAATGSGYTV